LPHEALRHPDLLAARVLLHSGDLEHARVSASGNGDCVGPGYGARNGAPKSNGPKAGGGFVKVDRFVHQRAVRLEGERHAIAARELLQRHVADAGGGGAGDINGEHARIAFVARPEQPVGADRDRGQRLEFQRTGA